MRRRSRYFQKGEKNKLTIECRTNKLLDKTFHLAMRNPYASQEAFCGILLFIERTANKNIFIFY